LIGRYDIAVHSGCAGFEIGESCVVEPHEPKSWLTIGFDWGSRVTAIGLEFALPALLGYGVDSWLGIAPAATIIGAILGFATGMLHTIRMAGELAAGSQRTAHRSRHSRKPHGPAGDADPT
jgi:hypothetical protein